jgi:hypothetical protein
LRFFPEVPSCSQKVCLSSPVPGGFEIMPGGSRFRKRAVVVLDLRVFIAPCLPTVSYFLPTWNGSICSPLTQALTPTHLNPNPTLAFKCGVIPCEEKQIQTFSCVLEHLVDPTSLVDLLLLEFGS